MNRKELIKQIEFFEKQRDNALNEDDKKMYQSQINLLENEVRRLDRNRDGRSTAQNIVGGVTRVGAGLASFVVGEVDACVTGRTDEDQVRRRRGKFVDNAENGMVRLTGTIENIIKRHRK